jgi:hypothetical protein
MRHAAFDNLITRSDRPGQNRFLDRGDYLILLRDRLD